MATSGTAPAVDHADAFLLALIHDTRALLRRSLTNAQLLERTEPRLPDQLQTHLDGVIAANQTLDRFLGRLADFANASHIGAGEPLPLSASINAALAQTTRKSKPAASVEVEIRDDVLVSPGTQRVIVELLQNALLFRDHDPPVIRVSSEVQAAECVIEVHDNGIGVETEYLDRVLDPLVRLHSRDAYPGFGLGLAISRRIVESLGGRIKLRKGDQRGCVATVRVPVAVRMV